MKRNKRDSRHGNFWHPDFRNPAALPDVKVVRTSFFLNVCATVVLCALLIVFFYREYEARSVSEQIDSWENRIAERQPQNQQAVELHREFTAEAAKVEELNAFLDVPMVPSEFLSRLAGSVPDRIVLSRVQYRTEGAAPQVVLAGRVLGISGGATDVVSDYEALFAEHPYFAGLVENVNVRSVNRNPDTGTLSFDFVLSLTGEEEEQS